MRWRTDLRRFLGPAVIALAAMAAATSPSTAREQAGAVTLLDVPYLSQSEALCGGAAAAMVLRFWGVTGVYAETFSDLVQPALGGIRGEDLVRAIQSRGWTAVTFAGDAELVRTHLLKRRPVIALIEDRPGRFHYVVIVAWPDGRVVLHDPARAPFRVLTDTQFNSAWQRAHGWAMLVLPPAKGDSFAGGSTPSGVMKPDAMDAVKEDPCGGMVREGVRLASVGELDDSRQILEAAVATCPGAAAWRELAGLRAVNGDWPGAGAGAREALRRNPNDEHAWRILATSRFVGGDADGALAAWNHVDEPTIDLINIAGLDRTRYRVAAELLRLAPNALLRVDDLSAARRRLAELPSALVTRVAFVPAESGRARVEASVLERPIAPLAPLPVGIMALRGATDREIRAPFASLTGGGELWDVRWRWWERRPRVSVAFTAPAPRHLGATWSLEAYGERQTYGVDGALLEESQRGVMFGVADWVTGTTRWHTDVGVTRWTKRGTALIAQAGVARYLFDDRLVGELAASALAGDVRSWTGRVRTEWRSRTRNENLVWLARAGYDAVGEGAPFALWPGAGVGQGRDALLRAHRLLDDGVISGGVFGARLLHGGVEARRWFALRRKPLRLAPAAFVDVARARRGIDSSDLRAHVDAGGGVRIGVPGAGVLRIDLARGLRDGKTTLSFGWTR